MNKKAEFPWTAFICILLTVLFLGLCVWAGISDDNATTEKHSNLCEKRGMQYFSFHRGSWGSENIVVCLDNDGEQHEVVLK